MLPPINVGRHHAERFNVLVVGPAKVGKKAFVHSLFCRYATERTQVHTESQETQGGGDTGRVTILELDRLRSSTPHGSVHFHLYCTQGYDDFIDNSSAVGDIASELRHRHHQWLQQATQTQSEERRLLGDERMHCLLYLVDCRGPKELDKQFIASIAGLAPVVPVLFKTDCLSATATTRLQQALTETIAEISAQAGGPTCAAGAMPWCCHDFYDCGADPAGPYTDRAEGGGNSPVIPAPKKRQQPSAHPDPTAYRSASLSPLPSPSPPQSPSPSPSPTPSPCNLHNVLHSPSPSSSASSLPQPTASAPAPAAATTSSPACNNACVAGGNEDTDSPHSTGSATNTAEFCLVRTPDSACSTEDAAGLHLVASEGGLTRDSADAALGAGEYRAEDYRSIDAAACSMLGQPNMYASTCNVARSLLHSHSSIASVEYAGSGSVAAAASGAGVARRFGSHACWWRSEEQSPESTPQQPVSPASAPARDDSTPIWAYSNVFPVLSTSVVLLDSAARTHTTGRTSDGCDGSASNSGHETTYSRCSFRRLQRLLLEDGVHLRAMKTATQRMSQAVHSATTSDRGLFTAVLAGTNRALPKQQLTRSTRPLSCAGAKSCLFCVHPTLFWLVVSISAAITTQLLAQACADTPSVAADSPWILSADLTGMACEDPAAPLD